MVYSFPFGETLALQLIEKNKKCRNPYLDLGNCGLTELPAQLFECQWIEKLNLGDRFSSLYPADKRREESAYVFTVSKNFGFRNKISDTKDIVSLKLMTNLRYLDLSNNEITDTDILGELIQIEYISLSCNDITDISFIKDLPKLKLVDVYSNKISDLSGLTSYLKNNPSQLELRITKYPDYEPENVLMGIDLTDNPISPVIKAMKGNRGMLDWLVAQNEGMVLNSESRCVLLGNGGAGKTSLSHELRFDIFSNQTISTHGILIEDWSIPKLIYYPHLGDKIQTSIQQFRKNNSHQSSNYQSPENIKLIMWDFGGQEYYHATHRLFLGDNVLYLLVWEESTNHQNEEKGEYPDSYWLQIINRYSSSNIVFTIQNKADGKASIDTGRLRYKIAKRKINDSTSLEEYRLDIRQLRNQILAKLIDLEYLGITIPKVYDEIRQTLRRDRRKYLRFTDYLETVKNNDISEKNIMTDPSQIQSLTKFLDDTGAIICFKYRDKIKTNSIKDYVFTDPKWLTEILYAILERNVQRFDMDHVGSKVTSEIPANVWIDLLKEFELIFQVSERGKDYYFVPQYLSENCGNKLALDLFLEGKAIKTSFVLFYPDFLPKGNFLRFISKYGSLNINYLFWKNGLVFHKQKAVYASCDYNSKLIIIKIEDNDETLSRELFHFLIELDDPFSVEVSINDKDFVSVGKLIKKIASEAVEIESTNGNTVKCSDFYHIARENKKPTSIAPKKVFISYSHTNTKRRNDAQKFLVNLEKQGLIDIWHDEKICPGDKWNDTIKHRLMQSDIVILLISQDYIASEYSNSVEMTIALQNVDKKRTIVIPFLLDNCDWKYWKVFSNKNIDTEQNEWQMGQFQFMPVNDSGRLIPLSSTTWNSKSDAWMKLTDFLRSIVGRDMR
jgi:GTPase SAR1 family protein